MNLFKKFIEKRKENSRKRDLEKKEEIRQRELRLEEAKLKKEKEAEIALKKEEELLKKDKESADNWANFIIGKIKEHKDAIYKEYQDCSYTDQYGNEDLEGFFDFDELLEFENLFYDDTDAFNEALNSKKFFSSGINYFFKSVILRDMEFSDFIDGWKKYEKIYKPKKPDGQEAYWTALIFCFWIFDYSIFPLAKATDAYNERKLEAGFDEDMNGEDYEKFCENLLLESGWNVERTPQTNDQGVDLIALIENYKVCIQCKKYSNPVGNKAVQEIIAGTLFYKGTHSVVVSNAGFTKSAKALAETSNVLLINDSELEELEDFI